MSSLWTPSGERPIRPTSDPEPPPPGPGPVPAGAPGSDTDREPTEEEIRAELAEISRQVLQTPASVVIANHCIGLFQLAAIHLDHRPPNLAEARLAIDALGAVVEGLGDRLGQQAPPLRDALTQVRVAFVNASKEAGGPAEPAG